ncbi:MAG TPA: DUF6448 family protein [Cyclobacteriaceae bacterium]|nr:DUF6448 family protein [Cyclobacteriaceae bacterium]HLT81435.1 DUF6448 family protein [Cyclobacteriaceae bacterium]
MGRFTLSILLLAGLGMLSQASFAHCDTKDGPVVAAAIKALEENNVNYVLIWVPAADEAEIRDAFERTTKVRALGPEARALADNYFFETLVRIHRAGEGVPYTGVLPAGTPVDEKILAADKSIELGSLDPLADLVPKEDFPELKRRFDRAMALKNYDVNDVRAGREYVDAYVQFFHFAEGEGAHGHGDQDAHHSHDGASDHTEHLAWILSGTLFFMSLLYITLYYRERRHRRRATSRF